MVVVASAFVGAVIAGLLAWRLPNFDPAAPRAAGSTIRHEVRAHAGLASFLRSRVDPATATGLGLTVALGLVVGGAIAIGALLVMVQHNAGLAHWDLAAARWGGANAIERLDAIPARTSVSWAGHR